MTLTCPDCGSTVNHRPVAGRLECSVRCGWEAFDDVGKVCRQCGCFGEECPAWCPTKAPLTQPFPRVP